MPNGQTHDMLTITTGILAIPVLAGYLPPSGESVGLIMTAVGAHMISGLACSPDLDTHSSVYYRWGLLRIFWYPYQVLIPHRSPISHGFFLGPLLRLAYIGVLCWGLLSALATANTTAAYWWQALREWEGLRYFVAGWFTGSMLHSGADYVSTWFKTAVRPSGRSRRVLSRRR